MSNNPPYNLFNQPQIELTPEHNRHKGNEQILSENREHFTKQALQVLEHLLNGEKVTGEMMHRLYGMQDFRPRIAALRKIYKDRMQFEKIEGGKGAKAWFFTDKVKIAA